MTFHLQKGDGTGDYFQIYPVHGEFIEDYRVNQNQVRTLGQQLNSFKLVGEGFRYTIPLSFVDSSTRNQVNEWWRNQTEIAFIFNISSNPEHVFCKVANRRNPFPEHIPGKLDLWQGVLFLNSVRSTIVDAPGVLRNLTLDDATLGKLDTATNVLAETEIGANVLPSIRGAGKVSGVP